MWQSNIHIKELSNSPVMPGALSGASIQLQIEQNCLACEQACCTWAHVCVQQNQNFQTLASACLWCFASADVVECLVDTWGVFAGLFTIQLLDHTSTP